MKAYIGAYTKNGRTEAGIYYGNAGIELFNIESFCCDDYTLIPLSVSGKNYQERKENARILAIDVMDPNTFPGLSYGEYAVLSEIFENIGREYGLTKEFRENCII